MNAFTFAKGLVIFAGIAHVLMLVLLLRAQLRAPTKAKLAALLVVIIITSFTAATWWMRTYGIVR